MDSVYLCKNINDIKSDNGKGSFLSILSQLESNVIRDTLMLVTADETDSKKINVGVTVIYQGCTTNGHSHENMEEVYFVLEGRGKMIIGDHTFDIKAGDVFYIPYGGVFHKTENTDNIPMKYIWVTNSQ